MNLIAPPHDEEAEGSVLGAIMLADRWLGTITVDVRLRAEDFYRPRNRMIFKAMLELNEASEPIDTLTVANRLTETGKLEEAGGRDYIETLVTRIPAIGNTKQYGQIVKEKAVLRRLLSAAQEIEQEVANPAVAPKDILEHAYKLIGDVGETEHDGLYSPDDMLTLAVKQFTDEPRERFATGIEKMDEWMNGGLARGQVMVVASWPNTAKSVLVDQIAVNMARASGTKACLYLTEMTVEERNARFIARYTPLTITETTRGNFSAEQTRKMQGYNPPPLYVQPSAGWTVDEICRDVLRRRWDIVVIDDIENLTYDYSHGKQEAKAELSRRIAVLAKDNQANCAVIMVSHLSRPSDKDKAYPRPREGHLRDSQMIAARADICCFLYREQDDQGGKRPETEVFFSRNRTGHAGASTYLDFNWKHMRLDPQPEKELKF